MPVHALKSAARQPAFTSLLVFILAVGIAFVTMVLSLAHSVFLSSVPYGDPDRIVIVWREGPEPIHRREATSYPNIRDWAVGGEPFFEGLAAYTIAPSTLLRHEGAERVMVTYVEPYFFQALDIDMAEGRPLADEDNRAPAGDAVVVLSHGFWQSVLGGDPGIVGTSLNLGGHPHTVVGVMSPRTRWLLREPLEIVTPFRRAAVGMSPSIVEDRGAHSSIVVGRLREGVTVEQAHAGMRVVSRALQDEYPDVNAGIEANVTSFADLRTGFGRLNDVVTVLGLAACLVFLMACTSATMLLLSRFVDRSREFSVRLALGATPRQFIRQALAEGVSVTLAAGALGCGLAYAGIRYFFEGNPLRMYSFAEITMDGTVLATTLVLALATTLLFGLVPAIRSARLSFHDALRPAGVGASGPRRNLLRRGLVVLQVALSVAVLSGGGLVLRSLYTMTHTDYGFETDDLVYVRLLIDETRYGDDRARVFYRELERRLSALPEVTEAGLWGPGVPGSSTHFQTLVPEGREGDPSFEGFHSWLHVVTPGAMERLGLRLVDGRMLDDTDHAHALPSVVVSQALAGALWPGELAVGRRIVDPWTGAWRTVVGVVSDARMRGLGRTHSQMLRDFYVTFDQLPHAQTNIFLRPRGDGAAAVDMVRDTVRSIDPALPLFDVTTMDASMAEDRREMGLLTTVMLLFAAAAALLTTVGIYSVIAQLTSRRINEIGVRMALGARKAHVVGLVLSQAALDVALGIVIGLLGALALGRVTTGLLYEVAPNDPLAFLLITPALGMVVLLASFIPVRRALRVDPSVALRHR
jgi:predicted permease